MSVSQRGGCPWSLTRGIGHFFNSGGAGKTFQTAWNLNTELVGITGQQSSPGKGGQWVPGRLPGLCIPEIGSSDREEDPTKMGESGEKQRGGTAS